MFILMVKVFKEQGETNFKRGDHPTTGVVVITTTTERGVGTNNKPPHLVSKTIFSNIPGVNFAENYIKTRVGSDHKRGRGYLDRSI